MSNSRWGWFGIAAVVYFFWLLHPPGVAAQPGAARPEYRVKPTGDFAVTGDGRHEAWKKADWQLLQKRTKDGLPYEARFKVLYSPSGLYVLMDGTDARLSATFQEDFQNLWTEDVYEFFLWTDERYPVYFEYEISPLNRELPILIPNFEGKFFGWRPWHYEGERRIKKATATVGGAKESGAAIKGWSAEVMVPWDLLKPLPNVPAKAGSRWRANFYRVDYDAAPSTAWDWARVGPSFHEYQKFGTLVFD